MAQALAAFDFGQRLAIGAAALSLGGLLYFVMSNQHKGVGVVLEARSLSESSSTGLTCDNVHERIRITCKYFGWSVGLTAATAVAVYHSPMMTELVMEPDLLLRIGTSVAVLGSVVLVRNLSYTKGFGMKHLAWVLHCGAVGVDISPLCIMGGPLLMKTALYTIGILGGMAMAVYFSQMKLPQSYVWETARTSSHDVERQENSSIMAAFVSQAPLTAALVILLIAFLGCLFFPATTALGLGFHITHSMKSPLMLFLMNSQQVITMIEVNPENKAKPFDPINVSSIIFLDCVTIFEKIVRFVAGEYSTKEK